MPRPLLLILITTMLMLLLFRPGKRPEPEFSPPAALTIESVQSLGTLVTTRLVVRIDRHAHFNGLLGGLTISWHGRGTVLLGPDLRQAKIIDRDDALRTATVRLPEPKVLQRTLDFTGSEWRFESDGLWQFVPNDPQTAADQQRLLQEAQIHLDDAVTAAERDAARESAAAVIRQFGQSLRWTLIVH